MKRDLEKRIAERAYRIWEDEGRPAGRSDEHWALAREAIALEDAGGGATLPNPAADHPASQEPAQPVEEAFIQENLGEFPTAYTDQGDREQTPEPRKPKRRAAAKAPAKPKEPSPPPAAKAPSRRKKG